MSTHVTTRQEHIGYVFVRAVAYAAGFSCSRPEVDDESIDLTIARRGAGGSIRSPRLELQIKCSRLGPFRTTPLGFQLSMKNYDDLRHTDFQVPRILIVVMIPTNEADCVSQTDRLLSLRYCGYWLSLRGMEEVVSHATDPRVTIHLQRSRKFDVETLQAMMDRIGDGGLP